MQKKLTITVDSKVYEGLHAIIGRGNISQFIERLARPYLFPKELEASYHEMAADSARENEADKWSENLIGDVDETR
jgi:predicted CopG family antitoxin